MYIYSKFVVLYQKEMNNYETFKFILEQKSCKKYLKIGIFA